MSGQRQKIPAGNRSAFFIFRCAFVPSNFEYLEGYLIDPRGGGREDMVSFIGGILLSPHQRTTE